MWCFVIEPSGTIHELILPQESCGFDCLDMIAKRINLVEKDYFGLQHVSSSGKEKWLNLRNRLSDQLSGRSPHRIKLAVKFFVKVQELQQPVTRDLYYASIIQQILSKKIDINKVNDEDYTKLVALKAQIQNGGFNSEYVPDYSTLLPTTREWSRSLEEKVETEHLNLDTTTASEGKIEFIKIVSTFSDYGVETFNVQSLCETGDKMTLYVCQDGLRVYKRQDAQTSTCLDELRNLLNFIPYDEISTVSYKGKRFTIIHGNDKANHSHSSFILKKNHEAIKVFRTFTEFHSFFQCNSVKKSVVEKCTRSSLGRLISLFNASSEKGKNYLFDVIRTRREAYERAWSILNAPDKKRQSAFYHSERHFNRKSVYSLSKIEEISSEQYSRVLTKKEKNEFAALSDIHSKNSKLSLDELEETVSELIDDKICQVCMDAEVSVAFCPCGHVVCCSECANLCRECPLCRTQITYAQRVFFCSNR